MTRRPRSHVLETESQQAFETAMPSSWVYRKQVPDYGFDGQVEVFSAEGDQTGLLFFVQLKATDNTELDQALKVEIPIEACNAYYKAALPVLMVRYHAPSKSLYARWWHTYDPYHSRGGEKTRTFSFQESDRISEGYFDTIVKDLNAFSTLQKPGIPLPIPLKLICTGNTVQGISITVLKSTLRTEIRETISDIFILQDENDTSRYPEVRISEDTAIVDFAGLKSFTLHFTNPYPEGHELGCLVADIFLMAGLVLNQFGHAIPASQLILLYGINSTLLEEFNVAQSIAMCLIQSKKFRETILFATEILKKGINQKLHEILKIIFQMGVHKFTEEEARLFKELLMLQIDILQEKGDKKGASIANYNYGKHLSNTDEKKKAFSYYIRAKNWDPTYLDRSYFIGELGTLAYDLGRYRVAERLYSKAVEMEDPRVKCHWVADSIMMTGRYKEALELYSKCLDQSNDGDPLAHLTYMSLKEIIAEKSIEYQKREPKDAAELLKDNKDIGHREGLTIFGEALDYDLMCPLAWFNLGVSQANQDMNAEALFSFVMAGILSPNDYEAWYNALLLSINTNSLFVFAHVAAVIFRRYGPKFIDYAMIEIQKQPSGFPTDEFIKMLEEAQILIEVESIPFEMRMISDDGDIEIFNIPGDDKEKDTDANED